LPTPVVGPGWNVFQYKKRDLIAQDRKRIISYIKSSLRGSLANLRKQGHRPPDRYILFLNVDLKHDQTLALRIQYSKVRPLPRFTLRSSAPQSCCLS
jgi:hypothetical protein